MDLYRPVADAQTYTSQVVDSVKDDLRYLRERQEQHSRPRLSPDAKYTAHEKIGSRPAHYSYEQQQEYYNEEYYDIFTLCDFVGGASRSVVNHGADER